MPSFCTVCLSPHAASIDVLIGSRTRTLRSISAEFAVSYQSLIRHARHVAARSAAPAAALSLPRQPGRTSLARGSTASVLSASPVETFRLAFGAEPMPHQVSYLEETRNLAFLKGRQIGATQAAAALAIHCARDKDGALAAVISPSLRQSTEICARARVGLWQLGEKLRQDSTSLLRLDNGSRIISLPGSARGIRGYPVDILILDEASWIADDTFTAARAMTAATGGRIVVQSTPGEPAGFFYELATATPETWARMVVRSDEASTIDPEFLARERAEMAPELFAAEYEATFAPPESVIGAIFRPEDIARAFGEEVS